MTQPSEPNEPRPVDWKNPAWTADTEVLATCLWQLIQVHRQRQAPAVRAPASPFHAREFAVVAPEPSAE